VADPRRVHLARGAKQTVSFTLQDRGLSIVDEAGKRRIVPGIVEVWIGGGQSVPRSGLAKTSGVVTKFSILGEATLPD
jgi:beta-glucosidase